MLAQNFLTADALGISEQERDALVQVLGLLERKELVDVKPTNKSLPNGFNMSWIGTQTKCGSVGCILGWARFLSGDERLFDVINCRVGRPALSLFMFYDERRWSAKSNHAALALRNYLTLGKPSWDEIFAS